VVVVVVVVVVLPAVVPAVVPAAAVAAVVAVVMAVAVAVAGAATAAMTIALDVAIAVVDVGDGGRGGVVMAARELSEETFIDGGVSRRLCFGRFTVLTSAANQLVLSPLLLFMLLVDSIPRR
jgi:hypothetical protein